MDKCYHLMFFLCTYYSKNFICNEVSDWSVRVHMCNKDGDSK